mgnify:CR=1 FL=1
MKIKANNSPPIIDIKKGLTTKKAKTIKIPTKILIDILLMSFSPKSININVKRDI